MKTVTGWKPIPREEPRGLGTRVLHQPKPWGDVGPSGFLYSVVISEKSMTLLARGYLSLSPNRRKFLISEH